jgi:hypothetical protein
MHRAFPTLLSSRYRVREKLQDIFRFQIAGLGKHLHNPPLATMKMFDESPFFHFLAQFAGSFLDASL